MMEANTVLNVVAVKATELQHEKKIREDLNFFRTLKYLNDGYL